MPIWYVNPRPKTRARRSNAAHKVPRGARMRPVSLVEPKSRGAGYVAVRGSVYSPRPVNRKGITKSPSVRRRRNAAHKVPLSWAAKSTGRATSPSGLRAGKGRVVVRKRASTENPSRTVYLFGAAAKAHVKRKQKLKKLKSRARKPKVSVRRRGFTTTVTVINPKKRGQSMKRRRRSSNPHRRVRRRRNPAKMKITGGSPYTGAKKKAMAAAKKAPSKKKKKKSGSPKKRKSGWTAAKRSAAARKAARTRKRNRSAPKRRRRSGTGRRRSTRGLKALRRSRTSILYQKSRKGGARARRYAREKRIRSNPGKRRKRHYGIRSLKRARRTIRWERKYGTGAAKAFRAHYKMNPSQIVGSVMNVVKAAVPVAAAFYASRFIAGKLTEKIPMISRLGTHRGPVLGLAMIIGQGMAARKVAFLSKHNASIMVGLGVNFVDQLVKAYAPKSIQDYLGDSGDVYANAMGEYVETGEYIETGLEQELGDYIETGLEQELGDMSQSAEEDLGLEQELGGSSRMLSPVKSQSMLAPIPQRSFVEQVPQWSPQSDSRSRLYDGIFAGGWGSR